MAQQKYLLFGQSQAGKTTLRELLSLCLDRGGRLVQKENEVPVVMADRSTMMKSVLRSNYCSLLPRFSGEYDKFSQEFEDKLEQLMNAVFECREASFSNRVFRQNPALLEDAHLLGLAYREMLLTQSMTLPEFLGRRMATTGINQVNLFYQPARSLDALPYMLLDVGGSRGERRKLVHCLDALTKGLFVVDLMDFALPPLEVDPTKESRLDETLQFLAQVSLQIVDVPLTLVFNKFDLFAAHILFGAKPFSSHFQSFPSSCDRDVMRCCNYLIDLHLTKIQSNQPVNVLVTSSLNIDLVKSQLEVLLTSPSSLPGDRVVHYPQVETRGTNIGEKLLCLRELELPKDLIENIVSDLIWIQYFWALIPSYLR